MLTELAQTKIEFGKEDAYIKVINRRINDASYLHRSYEEILRRLLMLPTDKVVGLKKWILAERVIRQLALVRLLILSSSSILSSPLPPGR